ncbi:MAG: efflux transporter periplasmic adaptor subunit [Verrucomicrobiales bacterium]|nr:efflux transporter periplasmic adaptor subunit [Verrucomicrobiales bacterium]
MSSTQKQSSIPHFVKWVIPALIIIAVVAFAFVPRPIKVDLGEVKEQAMMVTVDDDGETRVRERYTVSAPLGGRLLRVGLDPGDSVSEGDILATIDPGSPDLLNPRTRAQLEAMVKASKATVARAKTQVEVATVDLEQEQKNVDRNAKLVESGGVSQAEFEESQRRYSAASYAVEAANSNLEVANFELEQAKAALIHTQGGGEQETTEEKDWNFIIRSPVSGKVLRVHEESSRMLQPGASILEVGDPKDLEMRIDVLSQDAATIQPGQKVIIEHWGGSAQLTGRIRLVEPSAYTKVSALGVDEQRVDVIADFDSLPDDENIGDGYRIEARIVVWDSPDVVTVPSGALFRSGENWAVFRVIDGKAALQPVEIGHRNGQVAEILSGISEGDTVVLHPGDQVEDGTRVEAR